MTLVVLNTRLALVAALDTHNFDVEFLMTLPAGSR